jgi:hypothetical protein
VQKIEELQVDRIQALVQTVCGLKQPGCVACSADYSTCAACAAGLYRTDDGVCNKCADAITHCQECSDSSTCQVCAAHSEGVQSNGACYAPAKCSTYAGQCLVNVHTNDPYVPRAASASLDCGSTQCNWADDHDTCCRPATSSDWTSVHGTGFFASRCFEISAHSAGCSQGSGTYSRAGIRAGLPWFEKGSKAGQYYNQNDGTIGNGGIGWVIETQDWTCGGYTFSGFHYQYSETGGGCEYRETGALGEHTSGLCKHDDIYLSGGRLGFSRWNSPGMKFDCTRYLNLPFWPESGVLPKL